jgi:hypothetical protein
MTQQHAGTTRHASSPSSPQQLREEVERAREQLAGTVEELVSKADVKAQAREKASAAGSHVRDGARRAARQGRGRTKAAGAAGAALLSGAVLVFVRWRRHDGRR